VERVHYYPENVLRVRVALIAADTSPTLRQIREQLNGFKLIETTEAAGAAQASGYDLLVREEAGAIVIEAGAPTAIAPRVPVTDDNAVSRAVDSITRWAKWFNLLAIENEGSGLDVKLELKVPDAAARASDRLIDRDVTLTLPEGAAITVQVTNGSSERLYFALLDLSTDGSIALVYPVRGAQEFIAPGGTWKATLRTVVPPGQASIRDILKVIAIPRTVMRWAFERSGNSASVKTSGPVGAWSGSEPGRYR
jgi:hypothetical protein